MIIAKMVPVFFLPPLAPKFSPPHSSYSTRDVVCSNICERNKHLLLILHQSLKNMTNEIYDKDIDQVEFLEVDR